MSWGRKLRAAWRAGLLVAVTVVYIGPLLAGAPLLRRDPQRAWRWRCRWFGGWARAVLRVLHVEVDERGAPPAPPFLLVSNHLGYLDIVVLASRIDTNFLSKAEVEGWPVVGFLVKRMGTVFVDRARPRAIPAALAAIEAELAAGRGVVVFPEGTSSGGRKVLPFHPSLLAAALRAGLPVAWMALAYRTPRGERDASEAVCWWGDAEFFPHVWHLLSLPRIEARLRHGDEPVAATDRKELADRLWAAVAARLDILNHPEEPCAVSPDR